MEQLINLLIYIFESNLISSLIGVLVGGFITITVNGMLRRCSLRIEISAELWEKLSNLIDEACCKIDELDVSITCDNISLENEIKSCQLLSDRLIDIYDNINCLIRRYSFLHPDLLNSTEKLKESLIKRSDEIIKSKDDIKKYLDEVEQEFVVLSIYFQKELLKGVYTRRNHKKIIKIGIAESEKQE